MLDLLALALNDSGGGLAAWRHTRARRRCDALAREIVRIPNANNAQGASTVRPNGHCTIDIYVDSGAEPLAAYQVEFSDPTGQIKIVGVEGGEPAAFQGTPYYDPAALGSGRIVLAAYSTGRDLPAGKVRVARLRVVSAQREPNYELKVCVAGTSDGNKVPARLFMAQQGNELNQRGPGPKGAGEGAVSDGAPVRRVGIQGRV